MLPCTLIPVFQRAVFHLCWNNQALFNVFEDGVAGAKVKQH